MIKLSLASVNWPDTRALRPVVRPSDKARYRNGTLPVKDGLDVVLFAVNKEYKK